MSLIIQPKRWSTKPPLGVQINWGHPLASGLKCAWLFNEHGGSAIYSLVNRSCFFTFAGTSNPTWDQYGINLPANSGANITNQPVPLDNTADFSISVFYNLSNVTSSARRAVQGSVNNCLIGPYNGSYQSYVNGFITGPAIYAGDVWQTLTYTASSDTAAQYVNAQAAGSRINGVGAGGLPGIIALGSTGAFNEPLLGSVKVLLIHNRVLTQPEMFELLLDPYCFLQPQSPQQRFWVSTAAAPPATRQFLPLLGVGS